MAVARQLSCSPHLAQALNTTPWRSFLALPHVRVTMWWGIIWKGNASHHHKPSLAFAGLVSGVFFVVTSALIPVTCLFGGPTSPIVRP